MTQHKAWPCSISWQTEAFVLGQQPGLHPDVSMNKLDGCNATGRLKLEFKLSTAAIQLLQPQNRLHSYVCLRAMLQSLTFCSAMPGQWQSAIFATPGTQPQCGLCSQSTQ